MKIFYLIVLLFGIYLAGVMQLVTIALPQDARIASLLLASPDRWSLALHEPLRRELEQVDTKAQLLVTLRHRANYADLFHSKCLWQGTGMIIFAVIGLIREVKIGRLIRSNTEKKTAPLPG